MALVPRDSGASAAIREQFGLGGGPEGDPDSIAAGQSLENGAAYRNRTDDLLITRANEEVFDEVWE